MKVSEKQLMMLTDIAKESLRISGLFGGYDLPIRIQLVNDIINQQSNELKEVDQPPSLAGAIAEARAKRFTELSHPKEPEFPPNVILTEGVPPKYD